jgi:uncharacterized protein YggT (Ycf19 family)
MLATLIQLLASFIQILAELLGLAMFIYVLMSWFARGRTPLGDILAQIVEPLCRPFKWARIGNFDLSFILAYFLIAYGSEYLVRTLRVLAQSL